MGKFMVSGYSFEIDECANGWMLTHGVLNNAEYFPTLNELCESILGYVDQDFPEHRKTGMKIRSKEALKDGKKDGKKEG